VQQGRVSAAAARSGRARGDAHEVELPVDRSDVLIVLEQLGDERSVGEGEELCVLSPQSVSGTQRPLPGHGSAARPLACAYTTHHFVCPILPRILSQRFQGLRIGGHEDRFDRAMRGSRGWCVARGEISPWRRWPGWGLQMPVCGVEKLDPQLEVDGDGE
jgi:hypothetical protein